MPRRFRRSRPMIRPVIQSYKKVLNEAPASTLAGSRNIVIASGVDSVAAGQTGPTDADVPTGCIIKYFEIQISLGQIASGAVFTHYSVQKLHTSQPGIASNVVGGSPQRNQVFRQFMYELGENQTFNRTIKFMVPKRFQRMREGDAWILEVTTDGTLVQAFQVIYKFYR